MKSNKNKAWPLSRLNKWLLVIMFWLVILGISRWYNFDIPGSACALIVIVSLLFVYIPRISADDDEDPII